MANYTLVAGIPISSDGGPIALSPMPYGGTTTNLYWDAGPGRYLAVRNPGVAATTVNMITVPLAEGLAFTNRPTTIAAGETRYFGRLDISGLWANATQEYRAQLQATDDIEAALFVVEPEQ